MKKTNVNIILILATDLNDSEINDTLATGDIFRVGEIMSVASMYKTDHSFAQGRLTDEEWTTIDSSLAYLRNTPLAIGCIITAGCPARRFALRVAE